MEYLLTAIAGAAIAIVVMRLMQQSATAGEMCPKHRGLT